MTWIAGTSSVLPDSSFDVAVMTSHVAQFFVGDDEWKAALTDLKRALVSGGRVVFDTRDPRDRGWEKVRPVLEAVDITAVDLDEKLGGTKNADRLCTH